MAAPFPVFPVCGCAVIRAHQRPCICLEVVVVEGEGVGEVDSKEVALLAQPEILRWASHSPIYKQCRAKQMHCTPYGWRSCFLLRDDLLISLSTQPLDPLPVLSDFSAEEKKISELQTGFITRLRRSPYYVVETVKLNGQVVFTYAHLMLILHIDLERYSDKYRQTSASLPALKRKDLHAPFFPSEIFDAYFNPKKKRKGCVLSTSRLNVLTHVRFQQRTKREQPV